MMFSCSYINNFFGEKKIAYMRGEDVPPDPRNLTLAAAVKPKTVQEHRLLGYEAFPERARLGCQLPNEQFWPRWKEEDAAYESKHPNKQENARFLA